jgi:hypothetical protein
MNSLSWSYQEAQKLLLGNVSHALSLDLFFVLKQIASNLPQSRYFVHHSLQEISVINAANSSQQVLSL